MEKDFNQSMSFKFINYIVYFLLSNFYFIICNIPLVYMLLVFDGRFTLEFNVLLFVSLIPFGPSFTAVLTVMGKIIREKKVKVTKEYFKGYKSGFLQSIVVWLIELTIIAVLLGDVYIFKKQGVPSIFITILYVLLILTIMAGLYAFPIISRFYLKLKDIVRMSAIYTLIKIKITIFNVICLTVFLFIIYNLTASGLFIGISLFSFAIMYNEKSLLMEMEDTINKNINS